MKRLGLIVLLGVVGLGVKCSNMGLVLEAQTLPAVITVSWAVNPAQNVVGCEVALDGMNQPATTPVNNVCSVDVTLTSAGSHTTVATSVNNAGGAPDDPPTLQRTSASRTWALVVNPKPDQPAQTLKTKTS